MIVGSGLIASAFKESDFHSLHHVIFASGVSNSNETDSKPYLREMELIERYLDKSTTFVYFSTTSVFDPARQNSIYIRHKLKIEDYLKENAKSFLIVRLPIMVGHSSNPFTLINYLVNGIKQQKVIQLQSKACRTLLAIDDLVPIMKKYLTPKPVQLELNIPGSQKITIPDLITELENILHLKGRYEWLDKGSCYDIPEGSGEIIYVTEKNYIHRILQRYLVNS